MDTMNDFTYPRFREDDPIEGARWDITIRRNAFGDQRLIGRFACNSAQELLQLIGYLQDQVPYLPEALKKDAAG